MPWSVRKLGTSRQAEFRYKLRADVARARELQNTKCTDPQHVKGTAATAKVQIFPGRSEKPGKLRCRDPRVMRRPTASPRPSSEAEFPMCGSTNLWPFTRTPVNLRFQVQESRGHQSDSRCLESYRARHPTLHIRLDSYGKERGDRRP